MASLLRDGVLLQRVGGLSGPRTKPEAGSFPLGGASPLMGCARGLLVGQPRALAAPTAWEVRACAGAVLCCCLLVCVVSGLRS